nr:T9SS type A sorting domain-containing protein [Prolixibacteraceae bacterium]
ESQYTPREVIEIMFQTAIDIGPIGVDSIFGWGVPDLGAALKHIKNKKPVTFDLYGVNVSSSISLFSDNILDIKVFPNPVSEVLSIDLNSNNKDLNHIKLFNLSGKECLVEVINPNTKYIDLDLNALPNGVYMLHFCLANGATSSRKIIKK